MSKGKYPEYKQIFSTTNNYHILYEIIKPIYRLFFYYLFQDGSCLLLADNLGYLKHL